MSGRRGRTPGASPDPENQEAALEAYVRDRFAPEDAALRSILTRMEESGLPTIQLPAVTGRVIQWLLRVIGARRVLEVGTLAGYSALWIVRAFPEDTGPDGGLVTLEIDPDRAALARRLLTEAGVGDRVEVREGDARDLLPQVGPDGSFDAVFLDADKEGLVHYLPEARRLLRTGGLLLIDNALWRGQVADPGVTDSAIEGVRRSHEAVRSDPAFDATILPVGDGLLVARRG